MIKEIYNQALIRTYENDLREMHRRYNNLMLIETILDKMLDTPGLYQAGMQIGVNTEYASIHLSYFIDNKIEITPLVDQLEFIFGVTPKTFTWVGSQKFEFRITVRQLKEKDYISTDLMDWDTVGIDATFYLKDTATCKIVLLGEKETTYKTPVYDLQCGGE